MKIRVILAAILGTSFVVGALSAFLYAQLAASLTRDAADGLRGLAMQVDEEIAGTARDLAARAELVAAMPPLRDALAANDREAAVALLGGAYTALASRYGLTNAQVNSAASNTVLHRFHAPRDAGDDFTRNRQIIVAAHGANQAQMGVEIGASGVRVRGAAPVGNGRVLGSVEFGVELQPLLEALRARTNADFATLIDRRLMPAAPAGEARLLGGLRGDSSTNWPLMERLQEARGITLVKEPTFAFPELGGVPHGAVTIPLLDYSGAEIGVIVAARSLAADQRALRRLAIAVIAGGLIAEIGLIGIILLLYRGLLLRPVATLAEAVEGLGTETAIALPKTGTAAALDRLIRAVQQQRQTRAGGTA